MYIVNQAWGYATDLEQYSSRSRFYLFFVNFTCELWHGTCGKIMAIKDKYDKIIWSSFHVNWVGIIIRYDFLEIRLVSLGNVRANSQRPNFTIGQLSCKLGPIMIKYDFWEVSRVNLSNVWNNSSWGGTTDSWLHVAVPWMPWLKNYIMVQRRLSTRLGSNTFNTSLGQPQFETRL